MTLTIIGRNKNIPPPKLTSRHEEWKHAKNENSERNDKSRGTTRYSFASNLFDLAFNRGGKRHRPNSASTDTAQDADKIINFGPLLSNIPESILAQSIGPILRQLQELDAEEFLSLTQVSSSGAVLREGIQVQPIHTEITPPIDNRNDNSLTVRYIHLQEVPDQFSMGVFVFPPHAKIPLHDHPGMCVISRILYGDIRRRSLDLPTNPIDDDDDKKRRRAYYRVRHQANAVISYERKSSSNTTDDTVSETASAVSNDEVSQIPVEIFTAPACTVLYPHQGNLHEFVAGPDGAAVLDVLLPPYDADHHRDCTFYDLVECERRDDDERDNDEINAVQVASAVAKDDSDQTVVATRKDGNSTDEYISHPCWIVPKVRPEDFHCLSGQYRSLGR